MRERTLRQSAGRAGEKDHGWHLSVPRWDHCDVDRWVAFSPEGCRALRDHSCGAEGRSVDPIFFSSSATSGNGPECSALGMSAFRLLPPSMNTM